MSDELPHITSPVGSCQVSFLVNQEEKWFEKQNILQQTWHCGMALNPAQFLLNPVADLDPVT